MRLSFSAVDTFNSCARKYKLNYIDKIRPIQKPSPFSFGSSIDEASEHYLNNLGDVCNAFKSLAVYETAMRKEHAENDVKYSQVDVQLELIEESVLDKIVDGSGMDIEDPKDFLKYCKENMLHLDESEIKLLKSIQIEAVVAKGKMMLPLLFDWADENIEEVHSCQRKIEVSNEEGDTFVGYLDFEVTLKNGKRYIIDLKTSSNPGLYYPDDSACNSDQLAIYSEHTDIENVGYFVLDKKIRKREPRVRSREVRGIITEEKKDEIFTKIEETRIKINEGRFNKNTDACFNFGKCVYFNYCKNGSMSGLCKKE